MATSAPASYAGGGMAPIAAAAETAAGAGRSILAASEAESAPAGGGLAHLREGALELVALLERLAVPAVLVLDERDALALLRRRDDGQGLPRHGCRERRQNGLGVVPVDRQRLPAEGGEAGAVRLGIVAVHRALALAETVDVDDGDQVVELLVRRQRRRLPHRAFGGLAVAEQHVDSRRVALALERQRRADAHRESLAERSGGRDRAGEPGRGMALEIAVDAAQSQQALHRNRSRLRPRGIEQRGRVSLREHEAVVVGMRRIVRMVAHDPEEERGDEVRGRQARGGVARPRFRGRAQAVLAQSGGDGTQRLVAIGGGGGAPGERREQIDHLPLAQHRAELEELLARDHHAGVAVGDADLHQEVAHGRAVGDVDLRDSVAAVHEMLAKSCV